MREAPISVTVEYLPSPDHCPHNTSIFTLPGSAISTADNLFLTLDLLGVSGRPKELLQHFIDSVGASTFRRQRFTSGAWAEVLRPAQMLKAKRKQDKKPALMEPLTGEDDVGHIKFIYVLYHEERIGYDLLVAPSPVNPVEAYPEVEQRLQMREMRELEVREKSERYPTAEQMDDLKMVEESNVPPQRTPKEENVVAPIATVPTAVHTPEEEQVVAPAPAPTQKKAKAGVSKVTQSPPTAPTVKEEQGLRRSARVQNAKDKEKEKENKGKGKEPVRR